MRDRIGIKDGRSATASRHRHHGLQQGGARQNQQIRWCRALVPVKGLAQPCCTFDVEHGETASAQRYATKTATSEAPRPWSIRSLRDQPDRRTNRRGMSQDLCVSMTQVESMVHGKPGGTTDQTLHSKFRTLQNTHVKETTQTDSRTDHELERTRQTSWQYTVADVAALALLWWAGRRRRNPRLQCRLAGSQ